MNGFDLIALDACTIIFGCLTGDEQLVLSSVCKNLYKYALSVNAWTSGYLLIHRKPLPVHLPLIIQRHKVRHLHLDQCRLYSMNLGDCDSLTEITLTQCGKAAMQSDVTLPLMRHGRTSMNHIVNGSHLIGSVGSLISNEVHHFSLPTGLRKLTLCHVNRHAKWQLQASQLQEVRSITVLSHVCDNVIRMVSCLAKLGYLDLFHVGDMCYEDSLRELEDHQNLKRLRLKSVCISKGVRLSVGCIPNLTHLKLDPSVCYDMDSYFSYFTGLVHLEWLEVRTWKAPPPEDFAHLTNLKQLKRFGLECCIEDDIDDEVLRSISSITTLKVIAIRECPTVTPCGVAHLLSLPLRPRVFSDNQHIIKEFGEAKKSDFDSFGED
jgi:hypothetical protein